MTPRTRRDLSRWGLLAAASVGFLLDQPDVMLYAFLFLISTLLWSATEYLDDLRALTIAGFDVHRGVASNQTLRDLEGYLTDRRLPGDDK